MVRRLGAAVAAVALLAVGCSSSSSSGRRTVTVNVDNKTDAFVGNFDLYFPSDVTVRQGDTVDFKSFWNGAPHTVTMGTLVEKGLTAADALGADATEEPPDLQKIPEFFPEPPITANQSVAQPCFLATGDPPGPGQTPCTKDQQNQPDFNGTQSFYNSGWLPSDAVFKVKLASDIAPGVYRYFCTLHRTAQQGRITVVESDGPGQTASEVSTAGQNQLSQVVSQLQPAAQALKTGALPPLFPAPVPGQVIAGAGVDSVQSAFINEFGPNTTPIEVGGSVTWPVIGPHTISFNSPIAPGDYITKASDGTVNVNPAAFGPAGGPPVPPPADGPPPAGPPPPPAITNGGTWDGTGFRSSGIILSFPPVLSGYELTFTKAGTYSYVCTLHPGMVGTIQVG